MSAKDVYPMPDIPLSEVVYARNGYNSAKAAHERDDTRRSGRELRYAEDRLKAILFLHRDALADLVREQGLVPAGF